MCKVQIFCLLTFTTLTRCKNNAFFVDNLNKIIENFVVDKEQKKIVIAGDFNIALDSDLDCSGGNSSKKDSVKNIQDL